MAAARVPMEWKQASGDSLPYEAGTFDTVVTCLVLCTKTHDPSRIVAETRFCTSARQKASSTAARGMAWAAAASATATG